MEAAAEEGGRALDGGGGVGALALLALDLRLQVDDLRVEELLLGARLQQQALELLRLLRRVLALLVRAVDLAQRRLDGVAGVLLLLLDDDAEEPALLRLLEREERLDLDHVELGARPHHQVEHVAEEQRHRHDLQRVRLEARRPRHRVDLERRALEHVRQGKGVERLDEQVHLADRGRLHRRREEQPRADDGAQEADEARLPPRRRLRRLLPRRRRHVARLLEERVVRAVVVGPLVVDREDAREGPLRDHAGADGRDQVAPLRERVVVDGRVEVRVAGAAHQREVHGHREQVVAKDDVEGPRHRHHVGQRPERLPRLLRVRAVP